METPEVNSLLRELGREFDREIRLLKKMLITVRRQAEVVESNEFGLYARIEQEKVDLLHAICEHSKHLLDLKKTLMKVEAKSSSNAELEIETKMEEIARILRQIMRIGEESQFEITPVFEA